MLITGLSAGHSVTENNVINNSVNVILIDFLFNSSFITFIIREYTKKGWQSQPSYEIFLNYFVRITF